MDRAGQILVFPKKADICEINRRMIERFGGFYSSPNKNLANESSLDYILDAVRGSLYGRSLYPSLAEKAAAFVWFIITRHIFHDGNKRTGMESARLFLELNGYDLRIDMPAVETALGVASGSVNFARLVGWISERIAPLHI